MAERCVEAPPALEWSLKRPNTAGLWLRVNPPIVHVNRCWIIKASDNVVLAGIGKGLYVSWNNKLLNVEDLPEFLWYGPIPPAPTSMNG